MLCWLVRCGGLVLTIEFVFVLVCDLFAVLFYGVFRIVCTKLAQKRFRFNHIRRAYKQIPETSRLVVELEYNGVCVLVQDVVGSP